MQLSFDAMSDCGSAKPKIFSVRELVHLASRKLEAQFGDIWVEGEVSNLRQPSSGHLYFTLKDEQAQLPVVLFRSVARKLTFNIEDGLQLRCRGALGIFEPQGRFQLTAGFAEPAGVGALQLAFEQLKRKLEAEGLFDPAHKKPLPPFPRSIAVVTSPTGAAVRDIIRVAHNRFPVRIIVCPTSVQGKEAPQEIALALERADKLEADLIIVGRGGGSLEDLWAFNTEVVARAIFQAHTPVISAVGHEVDVTIADFVADKRAPTPSGAAELAVPVDEEVRKQLVLMRNRLLKTVKHRLQNRLLAFSHLKKRLGSPEQRINRYRLMLDEMMKRAEATVVRLIARRREYLFKLEARLAAREPRTILHRQRVHLDHLKRNLIEVTRRRLAQESNLLSQAVAKLQALSPLATLDRGYALVYDKHQKVVRRLQGLKIGDELWLRLSGGKVRCEIRELEPNEELESNER